MHRRIHLKKRRKWLIKRNPQRQSTSRKIIISIILILFFLTISFFYINRKVSPILMNYAESEIKRLSNYIINQAITNEVIDDLDTESLFITDKGEDGTINTIDFNPQVVNHVLSDCTSNVQTNLKYLEQGKLDSISDTSALLSEYQNKKIKKGVVYEIPSGIVFGNSLLNNLGPKIPVRVHLVGDIESSVHTKITDYGINNALIEVFVTIQINEQVILPFISKTIGVKTDIPVAMKLMSGKIPDAYFGNMDKTSTVFSLPSS